MAFDQLDVAAEPQIQSDNPFLDKVRKPDFDKAAADAESIEKALKKFNITCHGIRHVCLDLSCTPTIEIIPEKDGIELPHIVVAADGDTAVQVNGEFYLGARGSIAEIVREICNCCEERGIALPVPPEPAPRKSAFSLFKLIPGGK